MTKIFDESYFSSVRNPSGVEIALMSSVIPNQGISDATAARAQLEKFTAKTKKLGEFAIHVMSEKSDKAGNFESGSTPKILLYQAAGQFSDTIIIISGNIKEITYTLTTVDGTDYTAQADVSDRKYIEIKSEDGAAISELEISILSTVKPSSSVVIDGIVSGNILFVEQNDIEQMTMTLKTDITLSSLPTMQMDLTLFDTALKYFNFTFDIVRIEYVYHGTESDYFSFPIYLFKNEESKNEAKTELVRTTITAVDILQYLSKTFSSKNYFGSVTRSPISDVLDKAAWEYRNKVSVEYANTLSDIERGFIYNAVYGMPFYSALQKLCFAAGKLIYFDNNRLMIDNWRGSVINKAEGISFFDQLEKPQLSVLPSLRELTLSSKIASVGEKKQLLEQVPIYITPTLSATVYFDRGYIVPLPEDDTENCVRIFNDNSPREDVTELFDYEVLSDCIHVSSNSQYGGNLYLSVSGYKVDFTDYAQTFSNNANGEDLKIDSDVYSPAKNAAGLEALSFLADMLFSAYSYTDKYSLKARGRFDLDLLDCIPVEIRRGVFRNLLITSHKLTFNGAFTSQIEALAVSDEKEALFPSNELFPENTLTPKEWVTDGV